MESYKSALCIQTDVDVRMKWIRSYYFYIYIYIYMARFCLITIRLAAYIGDT